MTKKLSKEIIALKAKTKAKGKGNVKFKIASGRSSSLSQVITTKEEADTFMKFLRAL